MTPRTTPEKPPLKILMIEDNADDVLLIERALKKARLDFQSLQVDKRQELIDSLQTFQPDIVLSDHALPGFNSREALGITLKHAPKIPFIFVSGTATDEFAAAVLREGASDYIPKKDLTPLADAIRHALDKRAREKKKRDAKLALRRQYADVLALNESIGNFSHTVAGHLRSPLSTVIGLLNLAGQYYRIEDVRPLHDLMRISLLKMDDTLKALLEYAQNRNNEVRSEPIAWDTLIKTIFSRLAYLQPQPAITPEVNLDIEVPFASDPDRLSIIITNILHNALIYRKPLSAQVPVIRVEVITTAEHAVLIIQDNGIGIREDVLPQVYDLFFRGSSVSSGPGLGLYVARELVTRLRGTIDITSREGFGTTVRIELPNNDTLM